MRKLFKPLSILLIAIMLIGSLAGCGKKDNNGAVMLEWYLIGGKPNNYDAAMEAMNKYSIEKIGVGAHITYLDWGIWGDKVNAMLSSGEYFDIMFVGGGELEMGVQLGAFEDLTKLIDKAPALKAYIPEKVWSGEYIGGKLMAVPTYKDSSQTQYWVWDKEIVEKYGIDYKNIKSVKELDPVLTMLQGKIKSGEIKGLDYAFTVAKDGINGFTMNYERPIPAIGVRFDDKDAKLVNVFEQDDIMEILTYMHKWYTEGIVNPDAATIDNGPSWVIVSSGQGFPGADVSWSAGRGKETISTPFAGPLYSTGTIRGSQNAISSASKHKEEAIKYLELCNTDPVMRNMLAYGVEGTDWTDNGDGTISRSENCYSPATYAQATFFTMKPVAPNTADQWTMVKDWNEKADASVLLGFSFDMSKVTNQVAACDLVMSRYENELYTGTADPAVAVPKLYEELKAAGLEDIRKELQSQIDAWMKTK